MVLLPVLRAIASTLGMRAIGTCTDALRPKLCCSIGAQTAIHLFRVALWRDLRKPPLLAVVSYASSAKCWLFVCETKEVQMRKLLIGTAVAAAAMVATPAAAQIYIGIGHAPSSYGYGYGYSPYSYGYSPYSYGSYGSYGYSPYSYGYSPYSYGYAYPSSSYGYSSYGYSYPTYRTRYSSCLRRHHRNGIVYYTRSC